uniref:Uncharacterized protein n=1 Tax=Ciona savignyi TaxID=51511 RepID=H2Y5S1_CIOSA
MMVIEPDGWNSPADTRELECLEGFVESPQRLEQDSWEEDGNNGRYLYPHQQSEAWEKQDMNPEVEWIRPQCYLVTYFTGHPRDAVNHHFERSLRITTHDNQDRIDAQSSETDSINQSLSPIVSPGSPVVTSCDQSSDCDDLDW